jgi:hypothetical protein
MPLFACCRHIWLFSTLCLPLCGIGAKALAEEAVDWRYGQLWSEQPQYFADLADVADMDEHRIRQLSQSIDNDACRADFDDIPCDYWAFDAVNTLLDVGMTSGCGAGLYCPLDIVTRAQLSVLLLRGRYGREYNPPAASGTRFEDVGTQDFAADWIEKLAADGIDSGCSASLYCPNASITRAQMAIFLLRAYYGGDYVPPPASGARFSDVGAQDFAADWIEQLAAEGVTAGCGGGRYCPDVIVLRAQMAVFFLRLFDL